MSRTILNVFLLVVLGAIVWLNVLKGRELSQPNVEFLPEMVHSVPVDAHEASTMFLDGKILQRPVDGSIARGQLPLHYDMAPEDSVPAGLELMNPYSPDNDTALQRGAKVYAIYCQHCHGAKGLGDGAVVAHGFPPPPSLHTEKGRALADGQMYHIVSFGQANMPAHRSLVGRDDRWKAILHVRSLQTRFAEQQSADTSAVVLP